MYKVAITETAFTASTLGGPLEYEIEGIVEFGRQRETDPPPYAKLHEGTIDRIVIAPLIDRAVPRRWFQIEPAAAGRCRITNLSPRLPIRVHGEIPLEGDSPSRTLPLPFTLEINRIEIRVGNGGDEVDSIEGLPEKTLAPSLSPQQFLATRNVNIGDVVQDPEKMVTWLQTMLGLLQSAASTNEFYSLAARALVTLMGMDSGRILLYENSEWTVKAAEGVGKEDDEWRPSRNLLAKILVEKRTFRLGPGAGSGNSITGSLAGISMAVVSPILNPAGDPIGVLYGERRSSFARMISPLDAQVVELLAWAVANGLARVKQELQTIKHRSMMEQFFTPTLAKYLQENPKLLAGRRNDITVMFADIRRFSTMTHDLGPDKTMDMLYSILSALHDCVSDEEGVLVDFVGDELMAMWGAPAEQPDHAARACRAALAMMKKLPALNETWQSILKPEQKIEIGIGINSGSARVGNVGSHLKFKYGPVGSVVNQASRIQGVNKVFKTKILITQPTVDALAATMPMPTRRLAQIRTVNIPETATVYELAVNADETWLRLKTKYEQALNAFDNEGFASAAGTLGELLCVDDYRNDGACLALMQRAATLLIEPPKKTDPPTKFDPVWEMGNK
jgi:adenylate cyclase